jgi:hypothetical protein
MHFFVIDAFVKEGAGIDHDLCILIGGDKMKYWFKKKKKKKKKDML